MSRGKVAIVTGSTTGIGFASARALAGEGFAVVLHNRDPEDGGAEQQLQAEGFDVAYCAADLLRPATAARTLVDFALERFGRIDVVVNNAGMVLHSPIRTITEAQWDELLAVNLKAPFFLVQAALDQLVANGGSVIMISSTNALVVNRDNIVYDTTKAALNHAASALALELRDLGVRVNTLMPGGTQTPALDRWVTAWAGDAETGERVVAEGLERGNVAQPDQIAQGVVMLATGAADWINGATIAIDGGFRLGD